MHGALLIHGHIYYERTNRLRVYEYGDYDSLLTKGESGCAEQKVGHGSKIRFVVSGQTFWFQASSGNESTNDIAFPRFISELSK